MSLPFDMITEQEPQQNAIDLQSINTIRALQQENAPDLL